MYALLLPCVLHSVLMPSVFSFNNSTGKREMIWPVNIITIPFSPFMCYFSSVFSFGNRKPMLPRSIEPDVNKQIYFMDWVSRFHPSSRILKENSILKTEYVSVLRQMVGRHLHRLDPLERANFWNWFRSDIFKGLLWVGDSAPFHLKKQTRHFQKYRVISEYWTMDEHRKFSYLEIDASPSEPFRSNLLSRVS
jgi:hypothetical protein